MRRTGGGGGGRGDYFGERRTCFANGMVILVRDAVEVIMALVPWLSCVRSGCLVYRFERVVDVRMFDRTY